MASASRAKHRARIGHASSKRVPLRLAKALALMVGLFCVDAMAEPTAGPEANSSLRPPRELTLPSISPSTEPVKDIPMETPPRQGVPGSGNSGEYRSLASIAEMAEITTRVTPNEPIGDRLAKPFGPDEVPEPIMVGDEIVLLPVEYYSDAESCSLFWSNRLKYTILPSSLLWLPPLANQREPRMFGKITNLNNESTIDTAIGGEFGLGRIGPVKSECEGVQLDIFAVAFTRFNEQRLLVTADYRVGIPLTYAKGPWSAKLSYEHTSTHLGDEYIERTGRRQVPHVRDEIVFGLSRYLWNQLRLYGQLGYSFSTSNIVGENRDRYDLGIEWSKLQDTGIKGQPFAALDFDLRSDQDFYANTTLQVGWQWKTLKTRYSARVAFEYYNGYSPYGQFFQDREDWVGVGAFYDW